MACEEVLCVQWGKAISFILFLIGSPRALADVRKTSSKVLLSLRNFGDNLKLASCSSAPPLFLLYSEHTAIGTRVSISEWKIWRAAYPRLEMRQLPLHHWCKLALVSRCSILQGWGWRTVWWSSIISPSPPRPEGSVWEHQSEADLTRSLLLLVYSQQFTQQSMDLSNRCDLQSLVTPVLLLIIITIQLFVSKYSQYEQYKMSGVSVRLCSHSWDSLWCCCDGLIWAWFTFLVAAVTHYSRLSNVQSTDFTVDIGASFTNKYRSHLWFWGRKKPL